MSIKSARTIEDIARLAGVSKSTVSRALNNSPLINPETRERIQALAREHSFRPNATARNLSLRQSSTIAFAIPNHLPDVPTGGDIFGMELIGGVGHALHALGYDLLLIQVDPHETDWVGAYLDSGRVDGFILLTSNHRPSQIRVLAEMNAPFIGWGTPLSPLRYCSVSGDSLAGGTLATQHLIQAGRRKIAFLGGPQASATVQLRLQGYHNALRAAGLSPSPNLLAFGDYSFASGTAAMQGLLEQNPNIDAVCTNSDLMAIAAIGVIQAAGRRVPQDVAVVGYDDLPIALYNNLPLTTIRQNLPLAGKLLAQNLVQYLQTGVVTSVTIPVELIVRQSA